MIIEILGILAAGIGAYGAGTWIANSITRGVD